MRAIVNAFVHQAAVPEPSGDAGPFHAGLPGYRPTPVRELSDHAAEFGVAGVSVKDESRRFGLPAFKVLGASWAIECALRDQPDTRQLVAASAGNHGRAVAHLAADRGLGCRIFLPARAAEARREAISAEGAEVVVVENDYEEAVALAREYGLEEGVLEIADVGDSMAAHRVIDGYSTLFAEAEVQADFDLLVVPVGVGSLAAAAARFAAGRDIRVLGVEPTAAACLSASLKAGEPAIVATPGTSMAGMDCAEVSAAAWPSLLPGIHGTVVVNDREAEGAMAELVGAGLALGQCGAAPLAALRALTTDDRCAELRDAVALRRTTRVLLVGTEGITDVRVT